MKRIDVMTPPIADPPDRCPERSDLFAFTVGDLPDERREAIAAHLEHCFRCVAELDRTADSADPMLSDLRRPLPPDLLAADFGNERTEPDAGGDTASVPALGRLGQYDLLEKLGEGGMGEVYRARHRLMQRVAAVKIIHKRHLDRPETLGRFQREIRTLAQLDHPNIVRADYADADGERHFLVMEYVAGRDLARLVREGGPLPVAEACACIRQAALGLEHAHEHGLVHRDIKPSNLILSATGTVKVLDLGLARCRDETADDITPTGQVMGTFDYMAPEQADNPSDADIRADLYSLGCTLFFLLTGQPPFGGKEYDTPTKKLKAHALAAPPRVTQLRPDLPKALAAIIDRLLAKRPADRYATPRALAEALEPYVDAQGLVARSTTDTTRDWSPPTEALSRSAPKAKRRTFTLAALRLPWFELRLVWVRRAALMLGVVLVGGVALLAAWSTGLFAVPGMAPDPIVVAKLKENPFPAPPMPPGPPDHEKLPPMPIGPRKEVPLKVIPPPPRVYRGKLDVLVERGSRLLRLHEDGALPLRKDDKFRIEGQVEPEAYVYVLWVDPGHDVTPVYPWDPEKGWCSRPKEEMPVRRVSLPPNAGNRYTSPAAAPGVATMVLFARPTPLEVPDDVVRGWFEKLPELPLPPNGEHAAVWFDNYVSVNDSDRPRSFKVVGANDPFARWQGQLQQSLKGHAAFQTAVSFARTGRK
jgi:serine/threonine protein kinase